MYPDGFDRPSSESTFLKFVAKEFMRRGTPRRKELASKPIAHAFVSGLGMGVPARLAAFDEIKQLGRIELPPSFVLKPEKGWSARGVMLLRKTGDGAFFDHLALRRHTLASIEKVQLDLHSEGRVSGGWMVEEAVESLVSIGPVPFDYKFYSFNGRVGVIIQIDRNTFPTRVAVFDGQFKALRYGTDYIFGGRARPGQHVIPLHAPEMLYWAQELSRQADSPFVSIDMYDSPTGPKFGEFTYSPGGAHKRMFVFSHEIIDRLDAMMAGAGPTDPLLETSLEIRRQVPVPSLASYTAWATYTYNEGARGAERLSDFYLAVRAESEKAGEVQEWTRRMAAGWRSLRDELVATAPKAAALT